MPSEPEEELRELSSRPIWAAIGIGLGCVAVVLGVLIPIALTREASEAAVWVDIITRSLTVFAGVGGGFALWLAFRRQRATELAALREHRQRRLEAADARRDATERRITELRIEAVAQLGSDKAPVRIGGLHNLERLGEEYPELRQIVLNELCAYLRMPFTLPADGDPDNAYARVEREVRLTAQRIIERHVRLDDPSRWEPGALNFAGATLERVDFRGADLGHANFTRATFHGDLWMSRSRLDSVKFSGAVFHGAVHLRGARIVGGAWFNDMTCHGEFVARGAEFRGATRFRNASFAHHVSFRGAAFAAAAVFDRMTCERDTTFAGASFAGKLSVFRVRFGSAVQFDRVKTLAEATFAKSGFAYDSTFDGATFRGTTRFDAAEFRETASFRRARFTGHASFAATRFEGAGTFHDAVFGGSVDFPRAATLVGPAAAPPFHDVLAVLDPPVPHRLPDGWRLEPEPRRPGFGRLVPLAP